MSDHGSHLVLSSSSKGDIDPLKMGLLETCLISQYSKKLDYISIGWCWRSCCLCTEKRIWIRKERLQIRTLQGQATESERNQVAVGRRNPGRKAGECSYKHYEYSYAWLLMTWPVMQEKGHMQDSLMTTCWPITSMKSHKFPEKTTRSSPTTLFYQ